MENSEEGFVIEEKYEMKHNQTTNPATFRNNVWPSLRPFVNGCLARQMAVLQLHCIFWCLKDVPDIVAEHHGPCQAAEIQKKLHMFRKSMPVHMLAGATYVAAQLGSFEILTRKVQAANNGIPLSIYQEACCGLTSGAIGAYIWHPFLASFRSFREKAPRSMDPPNCRQLFSALFLKARNDGLISLWKCSGYYLTTQMFMTMGMLTAYNRSASYCRDSLSLSKEEARVGSGIVSAFFAAVCIAPCSYVATVKNIIQTNTAKGRYSYRDLLSSSLEVLQPGGRYKFYSGIFQSFLRLTPLTVVQWSYLEEIREMEESSGF